MNISTRRLRIVVKWYPDVGHRLQRRGDHLLWLIAFLTSLAVWRWS